MNRKQFIESHGATCRNWNWSWSFINESERFIIFGAWDSYDKGNKTLILSEEWSKSRKGHKQPGYPQSREHIRLIEEDGYQLKTFVMEYASADEDDEYSPAKIKGFTPELSDKVLIRIGNSWYASDEIHSIRLPEELDHEETLKEGASSRISVNKYERNATARNKCLLHHGFQCAACSFDFEQVYGQIGKNYIHVHHIVSIAEIGREYEVDPITDLIPICPNCHAMIHSTKPALTVEQLHQLLTENKQC
ncbi:Hnh endonuclease [Olavius sp. associated proteobacterium Delta 1]|nr:Hnh endonuclease [Olavius sp. associated proteobacterium Delta 1]